jgi:hypothetical protein
VSIVRSWTKGHGVCCLFDFNAKVGRETCLNRQLGMKVYTKLVMIME